MRSFPRRILSLVIMTGSALFLMGAGNRVTSSVTGSVATDMASSGAVSVISVTTGSVASRTTTSLPNGMYSRPTNSPVTRATATPVTLSPYAEELAKIIKFDRRIFLLVKEETQDRIGRLIGFDESGYQIISAGIAVSVPEERTDAVLASLRKKLVPLKYLPFVVEMNAGLKVDRIGILKGTDQYEILRIMNTDGEDYDVSNQEVIDQLKEWEKTSAFDIIGADSDWVELEFRKLPKDLKTFAQDVYDFCPDAVDQGAGSVDGLIKDLLKTKKLFLWWDTD